MVMVLLNLNPSRGLGYIFVYDDIQNLHGEISIQGSDYTKLEMTKKPFSEKVCLSRWDNDINFSVWKCQVNNYTNEVKTMVYERNGFIIRDGTETFPGGSKKFTLTIENRYSDLKSHKVFYVFDDKNIEWGGIKYSSDKSSSVSDTALTLKPTKIRIDSAIFYFDDLASQYYPSSLLTGYGLGIQKPSIMIGFSDILAKPFLKGQVRTYDPSMGGIWYNLNQTSEGITMVNTTGSYTRASFNSSILNDNFKINDSINVIMRHPLFGGEYKACGKDIFVNITQPVSSSIVTVYNVTAVTGLHNGSGGNLPPTALNMNYQTQATAADLTAVQSRDNIRWNHTYPLNNTYMGERFKIVFNYSKVYEINFSWEGFSCQGPGLGACITATTANLYVFNNTASAWNLFAYSTSAVDANVSYIWRFANGTGFTDIVNSIGEMYVLVMTSVATLSPPYVSLYTDYVSISANGSLVNCIWEVSSGSPGATWKTITSINDTSNCFQNMGNHNITFNPLENNFLNYWNTIRMRIIYTSGSTLGGRWATFYIGDNTLTYNTLVNIEDLYDTSISNGWNCLTKGQHDYTSDTNYKIEACNIKSTTGGNFTAYDSTIEIYSNCGPSGNRLINVDMGNNGVTFGKYDSATSTAYDPVNIILNFGAPYWQGSIGGTDDRWYGTNIYELNTLQGSLGGPGANIIQMRVDAERCGNPNDGKFFNDFYDCQFATQTISSNISSFGVNIYGYRGQAYSIRNWDYFWNMYNFYYGKGTVMTCRESSWALYDPVIVDGINSLNTGNCIAFCLIRKYFNVSFVFTDSNGRPLGNVTVWLNGSYGKNYRGFGNMTGNLLLTSQYSEHSSTGANNSIFSPWNITTRHVNYTDNYLYNVNINRPGMVIPITIRNSTSVSSCNATSTSTTPRRRSYDWVYS